jgi:hypothetical protein
MTQTGLHLPQASGHTQIAGMILKHVLDLNFGI